MNERTQTDNPAPHPAGHKKDRIMLLVLVASFVLLPVILLLWVIFFGLLMSLISVVGFLFGLPIYFVLVLIYAVYIFFRSFFKSKNDAASTDIYFPSEVCSLLIIAAMILIFFSQFPVIRRMNVTGNGYSVVDETHTKLRAYIHNHDGGLPPSESWYRDICNPNDRFPDPNVPVSMAMNKAVYDIGFSNAPGDMVLLFKSCDGINLVGGRELVDHHYYALKVYLANGTRRTIKPSHIDRLRWDADIEPTVHKFNMAGYVLLSMCYGTVVLFLLWQYRAELKTHAAIAAEMGIFSALVGGAFGAIAEYSFYILDVSFHHGWLIGGLVGLAAGLVYVPMTARALERRGWPESPMGRTVMYGMLTGIAAAAMTHSFLMVAYEEGFPALLGGLGYGAWAGAALGLITSGLLRFYIPKNLPAADTDGENLTENVD